MKPIKIHSLIILLIIISFLGCADKQSLKIVGEYDGISGEIEYTWGKSKQVLTKSVNSKKYIVCRDEYGNEFILVPKEEINAIQAKGK